MGGTSGRVVVFGSINADLVAPVAAIPRPGETVLAPGYATHFGGKGANQAVAAARAGQGTGIATIMVGRVGEDAFGQAALANLRASGVAVDAVVAGQQPTGCAFIVVDQAGENAITVASGANAAVARGDLTMPLGAGDILVLQMEIPFGAALPAAEAARAAGARVVWNFAPAPADFSAADLTALLAVSDLFVVNEREAQAAATMLGLGDGNATESAAALASRGGATIVLTAGADGAFAWRGGEAPLHVSATPVAVVDTTGAGDTFVGVLALELARRSELSEALALACLAASLACTRPGAQSGMPDRATLLAARGQ